MRSSVSVILSSPAPDTRMSHPDYDQIAQDHASILILVHHQEGLLKSKSFVKVWDKIRRVNHTKVTDSAGVTRQVYVRYVKEYPVESNDWGDFQTHRRLLGLITVGQYESQTDLNEICRVHESLKVRYTSTLYDSRCILFGIEDDQLKTPSNFKSLPLWYTDVDSCSDLESQVSELLNSLFWVLESKRQERSREKLDRVSLLLAPFERKDIVGLDLESRANRKKCTGRMIKHLGDLSLQAGVPHEALQHYVLAIDTLRSVNDWLWLGGASEGLCAASVVVLYPGRWRTFPIQRNASLPPSPGKRRPGSIGPSSLPPGSLTPAPLSVEDAQKALSPEGILRRYQEAIQNYAKYQSAGLIETEACFKAAQIAIQQGCPLQAASFLKNVVLINLTLTEQEKIQRFLSLSELYTQMGFHRKASLCRRLAATRHVSDQNRQPDWTQCYNLMLQALDGHRLSLDPTERTSGGVVEGWPALQIHLLQQLVVAARRMGHSALATRHMTFLLQTMWHFLNPTEQRDLSKQLQKLAAECEGAPVPLVLDTRAVIPPANLTNIPKAKNFRLQDLPLHLRPQKLEKLKEDIGPFLYTPISFGSLDRKSTKSQSKMDYVWVEGDLCEVLLDVYNPLPFELKVSNMRLLASDVVFESIPSSIILPPDSGPHSIVLAGVPKEIGDLEIQGYSTHTLGVKSNCQLRHMPHMPQPSFSVEVVPALPHMEVSTSAKKNSLQIPHVDASVSMTSVSKSLYAGESDEFQVTIINTGSQPIELVEITAQCVLDPSQLRQVLQWSADNIQAQLPLPAGASASFTLYLHGCAEFIAPPRNNEVTEGGSQPSSLLSGPSSLPSRLSSLTSSAPSRYPHHNGLSSGSFRSQISSRSGSSVGSSRFHSKIYDPSAPKVIDCQLKLRYSGGPGLEAGYCRVTSISLSLEILPSILITSWDVLPAETSSQFYLVLDVTNKTLGELELLYADGKVMLFEGNEECRIAVPVERCPLSKLSKLYQNIELSDIEKAELDVICSEHIASLVDLKWVLPVTGRSGKASLRGLSLTPDMLDIVRMSPLQWEVLLNKEVAKPLSELTCVAGQCLQLGVTVQNFLDWPLNNIALALKFFQEYQTGVRNYRLDSHLAVAGAPNVLLDQLDDQGSVYHECNVVFFMPGLYKIDIQCSSQARPASALSSGDVGNAPPAHIWKLIPPIEITVTDP